MIFLSLSFHLFNIFLPHFVKEVDPCEDLTDEDIRTAIQNATGTRSALFVPEVGLCSNFPFYCIVFYIKGKLQMILYFVFFVLYVTSSWHIISIL